MNNNNLIYNAITAILSRPLAGVLAAAVVPSGSRAISLSVHPEIPSHRAHDLKSIIFYFTAFIFSCPCAGALAAAVPSGIRDAGVRAVDRFEALLRRCAFLKKLRMNVLNCCIIMWRLEMQNKYMRHCVIFGSGFVCFLDGSAQHVISRAGTRQLLRTGLAQ